MKVKVKCPLCKTEEIRELTKEAPLCKNDFMQMMAIEVLEK